MSELEKYIVPWSGFALRHIPYSEDKQYDVYNFSYCGKSSENRWNVAGQPTLYLAKEKDVALAELARHFQVDRTLSLAAQTRSRQVFRFKVELEYTLDLTSERITEILCFDKPPYCFKDKDVARATANFVRMTTPTQAIFVPSLAFLDDLSQWCLVIFLEKLQPDITQFLPSASPDGFFEIS